VKKEISDNGEIEDQGIIIGAGRQRQSFGSMLAGAVTDIDGGNPNLSKKLLSRPVKWLVLRPKKAVVGIAGEFIKGITTNFLYPREKPEEPIDLAELQNIIQKIQWKAFDKARGQLAYETCSSEVEIKPINALLTDIRIDGYKVTNPLGVPRKRDIFRNF